MNRRNRREMLRDGAILGAGILGAGTAGATASEAGISGDCRQGRWEHEYDYGHRILFMDEYHRGTMQILGSMSGNLEQIAELTDRAAAVVRKGGTVWQSMNIGHMPSKEQGEDRRGNPKVIRDHTAKSDKKNQGEMAEADFDGIPAGDMVFTNYCNRSLQKARDRGVYVVSVPVNYINNEFYPKGYVLPNEDDLVLGDVSNEILHSFIPHEQGLVHPPEIPYMAICPSCVTALGALYWMLAGELAMKLENSGSKRIDVSERYLSILMERVDAVWQLHRCRIRETAVEMTHRILDGGRWFVKSVEHTGFQSELVRVASGPWMPNTGDWDANPFRNIMLIAGISPAHPDEVKLAVQKQVEGAFVIGIGPASLDGAVPPGRLIDVADEGFDNLSPESGGVIRIPGKDGTYCPTTGIVGNIIQQMICAQWADEMARRGEIPYFLMGNYRMGRTFNRLLQPCAAARGY